MAERKDPVVEGLRKDFPELSDLKDQELLGGLKDAEFEDLSDKEYRSALEDVYGKMPRRRGVFEELGTGIQETGKEIAKEIQAVGQLSSTMGAAAAAPAFKKAQLPEESYTSLIQRGYSPKVARNIF